MAFKPESWPGFCDLCCEGMRAFANAKDCLEAERHLNDFRLLCALREGPFGVYALNVYMKGMLPNHSPIPWLITRNDKELGVDNGTMAIEMPDNRDTLYLLGDEGEPPRPLPKALLPCREYGYAITIHKSQGSEYGNVCIVLPTEDTAPILTREILYTAITRTMRGVSIYGGLSALKRCVTHRIERRSGMATLNAR